MWTQLLKIFAVLGRMAAFAFAVIVLALISLTLAQRNWMDGISIFVVVLSCISIIAAWIPPYTNLLYDAFFAAAWLFAAFICFLIMFLKSTCYGVQENIPGEEDITSCPKFQALTAMGFLSFGAWTGCVAIDVALLFFAIFKNARARSHNAMLAPTLYRSQGQTTTETAPTPAPAPAPAVVVAPAEPHAVPAPPATAHFAETRDDASRLSTDLGTEAPRPDSDARPYSDARTFAEGPSWPDPRPYSEDEQPYPWDDRPRSVQKSPDYSEKKTVAKDTKPYPAAYGSAGYGLGAPTYIEEPVSKKEKEEAPVMAGAVAPVAAAPKATTTSYEEEMWETKEPEYVTLNGWGANLILRHWVLLGFLALIGAAVVLPLVFLYGVPAFAGYIADNIELPSNFYGAITGFYDGYATFDIITTIRPPAGISATLEPTDLDLFIGDTIADPIPLATVRTDELKLSGGKEFKVYDQKLRLGNITEWSRLWRVFAFQDELTLGVRGKITIKLGPLKSSVSTVKTQKFQGLLNATQIQLEYLRLQPPDEDGANIVVAVPIVNPAPLTVDSTAGVTADLLLHNTAIGTAMLEDFKLVKGRGRIVAKAAIDQENILSALVNIPNILGDQLPALGRLMAVASVQGRTISQNGTIWPYWIAGAHAIKLSVALELLPLLGGLVGDNLGDLLLGQSGPLININQLDQVVDVNVTAINRAIKDLRFNDAVAMGLAKPWSPDDPIVMPDDVTVQQRSIQEREL